MSAALRVCCRWLSIAAVLHLASTAAGGQPGLPLAEPAEAGFSAAKLEEIDALVARARELLGESDYRICFEVALHAILEDIRNDLSDFGVTFDEWFSERSLYDTGAIQRAVDRLQEQGHLYEKDGARWFRAEQFGDEKD